MLLKTNMKYFRIFGQLDVLVMVSHDIIRFYTHTYRNMDEYYNIYFPHNCVHLLHIQVPI